MTTRLSSLLFFFLKHKKKKTSHLDVWQMFKDGHFKLLEALLCAMFVLPRNFDRKRKRRMTCSSRDWDIWGWIGIIFSMLMVFNVIYMQKVINNYV